MHAPSAPSYADVMSAVNQNNVNQPLGTNQEKQQFRHRKQSTRLFGKSMTGKDNITQLLAANVNLVVAGVAKAATD